MNTTSHFFGKTVSTITTKVITLTQLKAEWLIVVGVQTKAAVC